MKLKWQQAPVKTEWGQGMVVASVAINKDHTLDLYCECDQTQKVETMLTQREWQELTDEDKQEAFDETQEASGGFWEFAEYLEAKLKAKNGFPQTEKNT